MRVVVTLDGVVYEFVEPYARGAAPIEPWVSTADYPTSRLVTFGGHVYRATEDIAGIPSTDPDADAFLSAAAISDSTISTAIQDLVTGLKTGGLWTKLRAIYPMVGGTAAAHKWNLKDPRDLDAAFRLTFGGIWTHSSTGAFPGGVGSGAFADTHWVCDVQWTTSNGSFGFYSRTDNAVSFSYDMGTSDSGDAVAIVCIARYGNTHFYADFGSTVYPSQPSADGRGFFMTNRLSTTNTDQVKNGSGVSVADSGPLLPNSLYLGGNNKGGTPAYPGSKEIAFAFMGDGMTPTEYGNLYTVVQAFQTALSRQV